MKIAIVPFGSVPGDLLQWCKERLPEIIDSKILITEPLELPDHAYDPHRRQFLGEAVLDQLHSIKVPADNIVGLLDRDAYASGLNFIFGQATHGREVFVALPRLRQSYYGLKDDPDLFRQRVLKEIVHELGHTWGLLHCPNAKCVMHFSNSLQDTDVKGWDFCPLCLKRLKEKQ